MSDELEAEAEDAARAAEVSSLRDRRFGAGVSLRVRTARGTLINGAFIVFVQGLGLIRGFVVAGFLTTTEYGVWGVLLAMAGTLLVLKQVGIADKFVQQDEEDQARAFRVALTLDLAISITLALFGCLLIFGAAALYDLPEIVAPGLVLICALPVGSFQLPLAIFYRRMDFARQRLLQSVDPLTAFIVTLGLAIAGAGYWCLVIGAVAGAVVGAAAAVIASPYRPGLVWDGAVARSYFSFSWPLFIAAMAAVVTGQGLVAAGQEEVGLAGLGVIALCAQVSQISDRADRAITDTMYPAICAVKDRVDLLHDAFITSNRIALMWAIPFGTGVALFSHDLLVGLLGERWEPGVELLRATALALAIQQIGFNWTAFYRARGDTRPIGIAGGVGILAFAGVTLPLLLAEGLDGLALGVLLSAVLHVGVRFIFLRRLFPRLDILRHLRRALTPSLLPVVAVLGLRLLDVDRTTAVVLSELALYLGLTAALTLALERPLLRQAYGYLRGNPGIA